MNKFLIAFAAILITVSNANATDLTSSGQNEQIHPTKESDNIAERTLDDKIDTQKISVHTKMVIKREELGVTNPESLTSLGISDSAPTKKSATIKTWSSNNKSATDTAENYADQADEIDMDETLNNLDQESNEITENIQPDTVSEKIEDANESPDLLTKDTHPEDNTEAEKNKEATNNNKNEEISLDEIDNLF